MRQNSSTATSAAAGSRRSGRANRAQNWSRTMRSRSECGITASSGRSSLISGASWRRRKASAGASRLSELTRSGAVEADLERDPAAHRVADQVGAVDLAARRCRPRPRLGEPGRVVAAAGGLVGGAEAGEVDRVDRVVGARAPRRSRRRRPCWSRARAGRHVLGAVAGDQRLDRAARRLDVVDPQQRGRDRRGAGTCPSKPSARSRSPRAYRRRCENASRPESRPSRSASQVAPSVPMTTSGSRVGEGRTSQRSPRRRDLPGAPDVAEADLEGRVEARPARPGSAREARRRRPGPDVRAVRAARPSRAPHLA